ncbi:MAG TPA: hypothetical protein VK498_06775 [Ferruginibacter sp.]|nr:hypothetical protein [Ferruginibacter sp.]
MSTKYKPGDNELPHFLGYQTFTVNMNILPGNFIKFEYQLFIMSITEQLIKDKKGKPVAVKISMSQYKKLLDLAEEMEDIRAYDKSKT